MYIWSDAKWEIRRWYQFHHFGVASGENKLNLAFKWESHFYCIAYSDSTSKKILKKISIELCSKIFNIGP